MKTKEFSRELFLGAENSNFGLEKLDFECENLYFEGENSDFEGENFDVEKENSILGEKKWISAMKILVLPNFSLPCIDFLNFLNGIWGILGAKPLSLVVFRENQRIHSEIIFGS